MDTIFQAVPVFVNGIETSDFPDKFALRYYRDKGREWVQWKSRKTDASIIASRALGERKFVLTFAANGKIRTLSYKAQRGAKKERVRAFALSDFEIEQVLFLLGFKGAKVSWVGRKSTADLVERGRGKV